MNFNLQPGNLLACRINTHRAQWNGTICTNPKEWNCSAPEDFRTDYCAEGIPRCFQLHTFAKDDPHFFIDQNGLSWILDDHPNALDHQVVLLYGAAATTDWGIQSERSQSRNHIFGIYRISRVEREERGYRVIWKVSPSHQDWICLEHLRIPAPYFDQTGGPYLLQLQRSKLAWLLQDIQERSTARAWTSQADKTRWDSIASRLSGWLDEAAASCQKWYVPKAPALPESHGSAPHAERSIGLGHTPFANLSSQVKTEAVPMDAVQDVAETPAPASTNPPRPQWLSSERSHWIHENYGEEVLDAIRVASATKDFMILSGAPGVGKSYLATQLLEDPSRERTLLLPVSATWRGREDLLGYVNPISGSFEETPFTTFVRQAGEAWFQGDKQVLLVVFEEFNLSPPEHWLSEVLTVSQFAQEQDRWIQLSSPSPKGDGKLFLSPSLCFVGTVNNDHTTQPLSPRVLDRVALIPLQLTVRNALTRIGFPLEEATIGAITDLDRILSPRGASFSIRTARALQDAAASGLPAKKSLDLILLQGMLTRVRLMSHDPTLDTFLDLSSAWAERYGSEFPRCGAWIAAWRERAQGDGDQFWA